MSLNAFDKSQKWPLVWIIFFSTFASVAIYQYGTGNHAVVIPFLKKISNPILYPGDYFIEQQQYYHTFLWDVQAAVINITGISIEHLFFICYLACTILCAIAIYGITYTLFNREDIAFLSVFIQFTYFIHNAGIGDEFLMDYLFKESQAALPFLLFALLAFLKEKYKTSYLLQGLGFLIHPLSSAYFIAAMGIPFVWRFRNDWKKMTFPVLILILCIAPLMVRKLGSTPESMHMFSNYRDWPDLLRARYSGHSFPLSWSVWKFIKAIILVTLFVYSWRLPPAKNMHLVIKQMTFTIFFLWILGFFFTEIVPLPIFIQLQLFRSYTLLSLLAVIYWSNFLVISLQSEESLWAKAGYLAATVALVVLLPSEGSSQMDRIANSLTVLWRNNYMFIVIFGALIIAYFELFKSRLPLSYFIGGLLVIALTNYGGKLKKQGLSISSSQSAWIDAQLWSREHTTPSDAFIVPPHLRGFRIDSERTIYGDYKDGIQMYFNPAFGYDWLDRMNKLGNSSEFKEQDLEANFNKLNMQEFQELAASFGEENTSIYLIALKEQQAAKTSLIYQNQEYFIYKLK